MVSNTMKPVTDPELLKRLEGGAAQPVTDPALLNRLNVKKGSFVDPLMQGATFGWADELGGLGSRFGAALAGAPQERQSFAQERETAKQREAARAFAERNPWTSAGLNIAGSLPTSIAIGAGQTPLRMAELGAAGGGIAGMGAADENKAFGGLLGTLGGGLMSVGIPAAIHAGKQALTAGKGFVVPFFERWMQEPQTRAGRVVAEQLQAGGVTPAALRSRARQIGPNATVAEAAGPPGVAMGQGTIQADKTGQARLIAAREYGKRTPGMSDRLRGAVSETTGVTERLQPSLDAVRTRQQELSGPLYEQAYSKEIPLTENLKSILTRKPVKDAFNAAKEAAETVGDDLPPLFKLNDVGDWEKAGVMPDMRAWDRIKQGIDRLITNETDSVTGRMSPKGRDLSILKRQLVDELDAINPAYANARTVFAGDEAIQGAMRTGERFLNMKTRQVTSAVEGMSNSEREAFLVGAVEAIREKIGGAKSGQMRSFSFLEQDKVWEKLRVMFPPGRKGDAAIAKLKRSIGNERRLNETVNELLRGSQTQLRQQAGEVISGGASLPTANELLSSPVRATTSRLAQSVINNVGRERQATIDQLARMLFEPGMTETVIAEMQRRGIPQQQIMNYVNGLSRGSALLSPAVGIGAGSMVD